MIEIKLGIPERLIENVPLVSNHNLISSTYGNKIVKIHGLTGETTISVQSAKAASSLVQAFHLAYSQHYPITLSPETIWYMISSEAAKHVKLNAVKYKKLFNGDPADKKIIRAEDNSLTYGVGMEQWLPAMELYRPLLAENIPEQTIDVFIPKLSTTDQVSELALLMSFMDAASPYYDYRMRTLCGIPRIKLEGTKEDWEALINRAEGLRRRFAGLDEYFTNLASVLETISDAFNGRIDEDFWMSIYKRNGGSGGPYVQGWITSFVAHIGDRVRARLDWRKTFGSFGGLNTNDFPTHISQVDFIWEYYYQKIPMSFVGGIIDVTNKEGFLTPRLGVGVVERPSSD